MGILQNKNTRALIVIMSALVIIALLVAKVYYSNENNSVDPRIVPARELYKKYNIYAQQNALDSVLFLMDTIESIYNTFPHYKNSFEVGVLYNNRAACYLTMAMHFNDSLQKDSNFDSAENAVRKSISIYNNWDKAYKSKNSDTLKKTFKDIFYSGLESYTERDQQKYLSNRLKEIQEAQNELNRRLSVSYTNLGLVYRNKEQYDSAALYYFKALELWEDNLTAENNLNILLGKPLRERNLIQKLFPKPKN